MISIITPDNKDPKTGGQKYNYLLYDIVVENENEVNFIMDKDVKNHRISFFYNFDYLLKLKSIKNQILIFDSRIYPRIFLFLMVYKLLSPRSYIAVTHHHFYYKTRRNPVDKFITFILEYITLKLSNEIIVPSEYTLSLTKKILHKKKTAFLPLGFDLKTDYRQNKSLSFPIKLLNVGTVCERKQTHLLVEIMDRLPKGKFEMHIVGSYSDSDPYFIEMKRNIARHELSDVIHFHGRINDVELSEMYKSTSLFTFASAYEGFGMVLVEAMLRGLPVVAFNNSAIPFVIKDKVTGSLVDDGNTEEYSRQIEKMCNDNEQYQKLCLNAFNHGKSYPDTNSLKLKMKDWIRQISKRRNNISCRNHISHRKS